jgi:hypothetical protein
VVDRTNQNTDLGKEGSGRGRLVSDQASGDPTWSRSSCCWSGQNPRREDRRRPAARMRPSAPPHARARRSVVPGAWVLAGSVLAPASRGNRRWWLTFRELSGLHPRL